jgi:8-oxo-dGTP diphosphatase
MYKYYKSKVVRATDQKYPIRCVILGCMQKDKKFHVVNVEGIIHKDGTFLVVKRSEKEDHDPGKIAFPGGKVEEITASMNTLEETLIREIREEVGVEIDRRSIEYVTSSSFISDSGDHVVDIVFLCKWETGEGVVKDKDEIEEVLWLTPYEIHEHKDTNNWTRKVVKMLDGEECCGDGSCKK